MTVEGVSRRLFRPPAVRPAICRAWDNTADLPCPHGCTASRPPLDRRETLAVLVDAFNAGGWPDRRPVDRERLLAQLDQPGVQEAVNQMLQP